MDNRSINIGNKKISLSTPAYIVAEMSANHGGEFGKAIDIIHAAKDSGADAVKLQTYRADTMTLDCDKEDFRIGSDNPWTEHKMFFNNPRP